MVNHQYMYSNEYVNIRIPFFNKELTLKIWINQFFFVSLHHQIKSYNNDMIKKIYGFPKTKYASKVISSLTDVQKQEYALEDKDIIIYDIDQFLCDLNDNIIPTCNEVIWSASKL